MQIFSLKVQCYSTAILDMKNLKNWGGLQPPSPPVYTLVKGSVCSWIDGSWSQTLTAYSDYLGHNKARFQVLVAEAATSIVTQLQAATLFLKTTWLFGVP